MPNELDELRAEVADLRQRLTNAETRELRLEQEVREMRVSSPPPPPVLQPFIQPIAPTPFTVGPPVPGITLGDPVTPSPTIWPGATWERPAVPHLGEQIVRTSAAP